MTDVIAKTRQLKLHTHLAFPVPTWALQVCWMSGLVGDRAQLAPAWAASWPWNQQGVKKCSAAALGLWPSSLSRPWVKEIQAAFGLWGCLEGGLLRVPIWTNAASPRALCRCSRASLWVTAEPVKWIFLPLRFRNLPGGPGLLLDETRPQDVQITNPKRWQAICSLVGFKARIDLNSVLHRSSCIAPQHLLT